MTAILAIDPGPRESAWLVIEDGEVDLRAIEGNDGTIETVRSFASEMRVIIETIEPWHGVVRPDALETMRMVGRLQEAAHVSPHPVALLRRSDVIRTLGITGLPRGKAQAAVRAGLLDRWGGGNPVRRDHPLHGIREDLWSALALAVAWQEGLRP